MTDRSQPPPQTLLLIALVYVPSVLSMATVGVLVPFIGTLARDLGATPAQLGLAIALYSMPTALLATVGGSVVDRYGPRRSMLVAGAIAVGASLLAGSAASLLTLNVAMLLAGLAFSGLGVGAPCVLMAALPPAPRVRAMSFLSTFAPTGYAAGLLLATAFVASGNWRLAFQLHAGLTALATVAMWFGLPRVAAPPRRSEGTSFAQIFGVVREPRAVRLAIAVALPNAVSYGTSLASPSYWARVYDLSIATSSATVAAAKIAAMVIGGVGIGYLLSRAVSTTLLFTTMVVIGIVAQTLIFFPVGGVAVATAALVLWLFAFGGMAGGAMALLPTVVKDPARAGAASGLVNQAISAASFAAPSTWLALNHGTQFVALAASCLLISLAALPKGAAVGAVGVRT